MHGVGVVVCKYIQTYIHYTHCTQLTVHKVSQLCGFFFSCTEPSEPNLKGHAHDLCMMMPNEPPVDEYANHTSQRDSPDALGETLPVAQPPTPPTTPPHSECIKSLLYMCSLCTHGRIQ